MKWWQIYHAQRQAGTIAGLPNFAEENITMINMMIGLLVAMVFVLAVQAQAA